MLDTIGNFFQTFNWTNPSWDLFILLYFIFVGLVYGLSLGRDRILILLVSTYMAVAIVKFSPIFGDHTATINIEQGLVLRVTIFLGVFVILFFILSQSALMRTLGANAAQGSLLQILVFSILHAGMLTAVTLSFLPDESLKQLSGFTQQIFTGNIAKTAWILAPVIFMAIMPGAKREKDL